MWAGTNLTLERHVLRRPSSLYIHAYIDMYAHFVPENLVFILIYYGQCPCQLYKIKDIQNILDLRHRANCFQPNIELTTHGWSTDPRTACLCTLGWGKTDNTSRWSVSACNINAMYNCWLPCLFCVNYVLHVMLTNYCCFSCYSCVGRMQSFIPQLLHVTVGGSE